MKTKKIIIDEYFNKVSKKLPQEWKDKNFFLIDGEWYAPKYGCDTIHLLLDEIFEDED